MNGKISRRTMLKGMGTAIALPFLEAMRPTWALADTGRPTAPKRTAFIYIPNGAHMAAWTPTATGTNFPLPPTLEPLKDFQDRLMVLSGLTLNTAGLWATDPAITPGPCRLFSPAHIRAKRTALISRSASP